MLTFEAAETRKLIAIPKLHYVYLPGAAKSRPELPIASRANLPLKGWISMEGKMKKRWKKYLGPIAALVFVLVAGGAVHVNADEGFRIISTPEVERMMKSTSKPTLIFSLSQIEFMESRIPGSICIPAEVMEVSAKMPASRGAALIFYCKGPG